METLRIGLEPASMPEWDAEDELDTVLAEEAPVAADPATAKEMLEKMVVELPKALAWTELIGAATRHKVAGLEIPHDGERSDAERYDFYLSEIPLTLIMPGDQRLVRLRLDLTFAADGKRSDELLAYDLFPTTQVDVKTLMTGEASLDVSKALQFALVASGAGAPFALLAKSLGLNLSLPFKWTSNVVRVQSSGRMNNPISWYVTDSAIQNGFSAAAIVRVPKHTKFTVAATLLGDLREWRLLPLPRWWKAPFKQPEPHTYTIG
jgi:hypothetical protein